MKAIYEYSIKRKRVLSDISIKELENSDIAVDVARKICFQDEELWKEKSVVFLLNGANQLMGFYTMGVGTQDCCPIDVREATRIALSQMANGVILLHNHPSNIVTPSNADIKMTMKLRKALALFDINLIDHIIIGEDSHYSFCAEAVTKQS